MSKSHECNNNTNFDEPKHDNVLIMGHFAIGDLLYLLPVLEETQSRLNNVKYDLWTDDLRKVPKTWVTDRNKALKTIVESSSAVNTLYPITENEDDRADYIKAAKDKNYDLVIYLVSSRNARFSRVARQIAPNAYICGTQPTKFIEKCKLFFVKRAENIHYLPKPQDLTNISQYYWSYFNWLFKFGDYNNVGPVVHMLRPEKKHLSFVKWGFLDNSKGKDIVFINGEASNNKKSFKVDYIVNLINEIKQQVPNVYFVINTSPNNYRSQQTLLRRQLQNERKDWIVFSANEDFMRLPAIIKLSSIVITADTATSHIALGVGTYQILLIRDENSIWKPFQNADVLSNKQAVEAISVDRVTKSVVDKFTGHTNPKKKRLN